MLPSCNRCGVEYVEGFDGGCQEFASYATDKQIKAHRSAHRSPTATPVVMTSVRFVAGGRTKGFDYEVLFYGRWIGDVRRRGYRRQSITPTCAVSKWFSTRRAAGSYLQRAAEPKPSGSISS